MEKQSDLLRGIPKMDELLAQKALLEAGCIVGTYAITAASRQVLAALRADLLSGVQSTLPSVENLVDLILEKVRQNAVPNLRRVINATGILLHTNLGRAPLAQSAVNAVLSVAGGYSNLEYQLETGERGSRHSHVTDLLCELTGAEDAMVVNNNAAAVLLMLSGVASGKEVIISRGELVEIGGSFRVPDIMELSGAILKEVGTTNRTHSFDYEKAIIPETTGALLKAHTSNYKIMGFTEAVSLSELVSIGQRYNLPVLYDLGGGSLIPLEPFGLFDEPCVADCVSTGTDVVCFSGDKLLGGPQAGILVGKKNTISLLKKHPLARALRVDKMTLAALEATLRLYRDPSKAKQAVPLLCMMDEKPAELDAKARQLTALLSFMSESVILAQDAGQVGGGSAPMQLLSSVVLEITAPPSMNISGLEAALRHKDPPVIGRIARDRLLLDVRTIDAADFPVIALHLKELYTK